MSNDKDAENGLIPFSELNQTSVNLGQAVQQANQMHNTLSQMGIVDATFHTGTLYKNTGTSAIVAGNGLLVEQKQHTTTVTFLNEGSTPDQAINEMMVNNTQEVTAAFANTSQPSISNFLNNKK
ncbi:hypothetical protein ACU7RR_000884 [Providencia stuartii]|uniref:Uncharacterized protein n=1 Tax=Providencia stuartii (strain MRSN 2154) TaxID=1157951 RepID=A0A140NSA9_PROSM|nr:MULTISPECIES: hypothetical protein [Providencia]MCL0015888.1 hypothetical protein [Providencia rettgeri]QPB12008.1 hypothetical protein [Providencia phage PSTCR3]AFH95558.1 hypothetical protein S70_18785 [Providencia stuartii MRSN 2154]ELR5042252.1 hypothetical protein [Providencia stuartii]ELR5081594.1 hypothetical protein [Providencia stuartii]